MPAQRYIHSEAFKRALTITSIFAKTLQPIDSSAVGDRYAEFIAVIRLIRLNSIGRLGSKTCVLLACILSDFTVALLGMRSHGEP